MKAEFLGWDRPLLQTTVDYFLKHFVKNKRLDLRNVVLALPGRRAINRLEELFVERVDQLADSGHLESDWYPPQFLTLGTLPESFYEQTKPIADDMTQRLAWIRVVDQMEEDYPDLLQKVLPHPPKHSDLDARLALGKMFAMLHRELAADALDFSEIVNYCQKLKINEEAERWRALNQLQRKYHDLLDDLEIWDLQSARLFAIKTQKEDEYRRIVERLDRENKQFFLLGLVDMNRAQRKILEKFERFVTPLVFAPESLSNRFDDFGCLISDCWVEAKTDLDDEQIEIVQRPNQQADAVLRKLASLNKRFSAEEIVIGVPDPQVIPYLQQRLKQANIKNRHFEGISMQETAAFRFLDIFLQFIETKTFESYAELLRHPDVEAFIVSGLTEQKFVDIPSELDKYRTQYFPSLVDGTWRSVNDRISATSHNDDMQASETASTKNPDCMMPKIWARFLQLIEDEQTTIASFVAEKSSIFWTKKLKGLLDRLFEGKDDDTTTKSLVLISGASKVLENLPHGFLPSVSLSQAIRLILQLVASENIPPHDIPQAIELIGWLEIVMDDAPIAIVTGMNDGFVPSFQTADLFLPDKIRRHLGLEDNRRRFARDAYSLSVILATRGHATSRLDGRHAVHLIGGRRSSQDDPMLPSRLFFAADNETVARRVGKFFSPQTSERTIEIKDAKPEIQPQETIPFEVPKPIPLDQLNSGKPTYMKVTEFADYVKCPYRYYLRYRLGLQSLDDSAEELDGGSFGTLIHDVLNHLAEFPENRMHDVDEIRSFLNKKLNEYAENRYGKYPQSAVAIQLERARKRIDVFARWQTDWFAKGNRIVKTEYSFDEYSAGGNVFLDVPSAPNGKMFLRGRIDRIDLNIKTKQLIVLDYKTSDSAKNPDQIHRKRGEGDAKDWVDFQLPLYHYIIRRSGFGREYLTDPDRNEVQLGYVTLPKDTDKINFLAAKWTLPEIDEAIEKAKSIARSICGNEFQMIEPPPKFSEAFSAICLDNVLK